MRPIKIYGESKTGTTYLEKLLRKNIDAKILLGNHTDRYGWKHGFPMHGDVFYIFIFRNVYDTIRSLMSDTVDRRWSGLHAEFGDTRLKHWHRWDSYFRCRNAKYYAFLGFSQIYDSELFRLEDLRKNPEIIRKLQKHGYSVKNPIKDIKTHAYRKYKGRENPNRVELDKNQIKYIDSKIDPALENKINSL